MDIPIHINNHLVPIPKLEIKPTFKWITDKGRTTMNKYLLDTFGTKEPYYIVPGNFIGLMGNTYSPKVIMTTAKGAELLKNDKVS